jgi:ABC-type nitrate/sulfonate/bicarbonate transport system substrate-binding protein
LVACAQDETPVPPTSEPVVSTTVETVEPESTTKEQPTAVPATEELDDVTIQLSWIKDAQFAGFFAADYLGYYQEEGIKVSFLAGGSGVDPHTMVRQNSDVIGIGTGASIINAVSTGAPLVAIGAINQSHPNGFLTLKDGPVKKFEDFEGHTIGVLPEGEYYLDAIVAIYGMDKSKMEVIRTGYDPTPLLNGQVDAIMAWIVNQPRAIEKAGKEWDFLLTGSVPGLRFYSTVPIINKELLESNPDLVQRWVCASMRGWDYVLDHPEEAAQMIIDVYLPGSDFEDELWFLQQAESITASDDTLENGLGWMDPEIWQTGIQTLYEYEQIDQAPAVEDLMTNQFIEACPIKR